MDTKPGTEPSSAMSPQQTPLKSDVTGAAMPPSRESGSSVETLRNIGKIKESVNKLDARLAAVEEGKVDQPQLTHLRELITKTADLELVISPHPKKADKSALETKVSRLQFDSATEQLNTMFHELLNKVIGQEQDWHKVIDKLSTEMECKLNRIELDSLKKQLEDRWKNIHKNLQAQGAPEHEDAAGLRKKLMERFNCLSCDRPVMKHTPGPERIAELTDYSHLVVSRSCGGSHTIASPSQRRTGLQFIKHHSQPEVDGIVQSEEVDILGLDGHIYKGRLNPPPIRSTETKLPTISTKDGLCKTKDKSRSSPSHKPPASPEMGHNALVHQSHSAKSAQLSRSVSSISGQDWPVSALGCASQGSISSVAAESNSEPLDK
ncbi:Glutamine-rich protein 2 [Channa argus]|uniref:Glutamine-rich protein 2 n=1 Tax=Channa argus TaxID=215402 RepID=A0A6G1QBS1_CHAAH|nr:Glutamine-rich protein 2 [Channa argus]